MKTPLIIGGIVVALLIGGVWWSNSMTANHPSVISRNGIHWHPELEIYVNGEQVAIPHNVGLMGGHSPIHTHEDLPDLHMEFEGLVRHEDTRLGHFFDVWGKEFSSERIFDHRTGDGGRMHMYVNGEENFEFESYHMRDGDRIEIRYE